MPLQLHESCSITSITLPTFEGYSFLPDIGGAMPTSQEEAMLRTLPILDRMRRIEGWLDDEEADLLIAATTKAASLASDEQPTSVVEVGSYCGKSTIVLALTLKGLGLHTAKVYGIDPHDGQVGAHDQGLVQTPPTLEKFSRNIRDAGVADVIEPIKARSFEVTWNRPIALLFIDALHDYPNVARDFYHFADWVQPGALVAFHDYADYFPGVKKFVDELLSLGDYRLIERVKSLVVLERKRAS
jgi:predicted O-methyltransferase YrrM